MRSFFPCALALALGSIFALNGCQLLESNTPTKSATVAVSTKTTTQGQQASKQKPKQAQGQYERAPDLSNAEVLTAPNAGASLSATDAAAAQQNSGLLISDANSPRAMPGSGASAQGMSAQQIQNNVALADRLEAAPAMDNAQLGAAEQYNISESVGVEGSISDQPVFAAPQSQYQNPDAGTLGTPPVMGELQGYQQSQMASSGCSVSLHTEASGIARSLIRELASRLRNESGNIYVAPTIVDREYKDCIGNLSTALQDGLLSVDAFQVVPATTNLNNIASQNIGSAAVLPNLIHQCRASDIPYLVVSQIKKQGENAALTLRIIRTSDGITLSQTYRRLSQ